MGYSPWSHKESSTTERLTLSLFTKPQMGMDETVRVDTKSFRINHHKNGLAGFFFFLFHQSVNCVYFLKNICGIIYIQ